MPISITWRTLITENGDCQEHNIEITNHLSFLIRGRGWCYNPLLRPELNWSRWIGVGIPKRSHLLDISCSCGGRLMDLEKEGVPAGPGLVLLMKTAIAMVWGAL